MNKKIFILAVACVLFMATYARPMKKFDFKLPKHLKPGVPDAMYPKERDLRSLNLGRPAPKPVEDKPTEEEMANPMRRMVEEMKKGEDHHDHMMHHMMHHMMEGHHHHHDNNEKNKNKNNKNKNIKERHITTLVPDTITEKVVMWGELFKIPVTKGDAVAVQIVRSSDMYISEDGRSPRLSLCRWEARSCVSDDNSLSFEADASTVEKVLMKANGTYDFTIATLGAKNTGVVVDFYVCVGKDASLATCRTPVSISCQNGGKPAEVMDVCVCPKRYTGKHCENLTTKAPTVWEYSEFEEMRNAVRHACCVFFHIMFFAILFSCVCCCCCIRACKKRRMANRGRVVCNRNVNVQNNAQSRPPVPPPAYMAGGYPVYMVPPPPPPPAPVQAPIPQPHRYDPYEGVELATMPARPANPVFIMPPLAPVKQVPVYVRPPAPKN